MWKKKFRRNKIEFCSNSKGGLAASSDARWHWYILISKSFKNIQLSITYSFIYLCKTLIELCARLWTRFSSSVVSRRDGLCGDPPHQGSEAGAWNSNLEGELQRDCPMKWANPKLVREQLPCGSALAGGVIGKQLDEKEEELSGQKQQQMQRLSGVGRRPACLRSGESLWGWAQGDNGDSVVRGTHMKGQKRSDGAVVRISLLHMTLTPFCHPRHCSQDDDLIRPIILDSAATRGIDGEVISFWFVDSWLWHLIRWAPLVENGV